MEKKTYKITDEVTPIRVFTAEDIKKLRKKTSTTQGFLANWLGVSKKTVRHGRAAEIHRMVLLPDY